MATVRGYGAGTLTDNVDTDDEVIVNGPCTLHATTGHSGGTWGGGTLQWYRKGKESDEFEPIADAVCAAADKDYTLNIPEGVTMRVKGTMSGATSPSVRWEVNGQ
ncbi:MAG: hypothetical protein ACU85V_00010 [Gammaproteobacteria bacterium]